MIKAISCKGCYDIVDEVRTDKIHQIFELTLIQNKGGSMASGIMVWYALEYRIGTTRVFKMIYKIDFLLGDN